MKVPHDQLNPDTLRSLIEHFVGREGTDYGDREVSLDTKIAQVLRRLEQGTAFVLFDAESETCNIATVTELREFADRPPTAARPVEWSRARLGGDEAQVDRRDGQVERNYEDACQPDAPE